MDKRLKDFTETPGYKREKFGAGFFVHYLNGEKLESPSKLLSPINEITMKKIPEHILETAKKRGAAIADGIEWMADNKKIPKIDQAYEPIFKQFLIAIKEMNLKIIEAEYFVINQEMNYCGFIDLICEKPDGSLIAIEVKTRDVLKYPNAYDSNHLQNNYYNLALSEIPFFILSLDSKGRDWKFEPLKDMKADAIEIHAFYNKYIKPTLTKF